MATSKRNRAPSGGRTNLDTRTRPSTSNPLTPHSLSSPHTPHTPSQPPLRSLSLPPSTPQQQQPGTLTPLTQSPHSARPATSKPPSQEEQPPATATQPHHKPRRQSLDERMRKVCERPLCKMIRMDSIPFVLALTPPRLMSSHTSPDHSSPSYSLICELSSTSSPFTHSFNGLTTLTSQLNSPPRRGDREGKRSMRDSSCPPTGGQRCDPPSDAVSEWGAWMESMHKVTHTHLWGGD